MATVGTQVNAPPAYLDQVSPTYHYLGPQSSPLYSDIPDVSERVLQSAATSNLDRTDMNQSPEPDFVYKADHMEVNVGPRVWGLRNPAYGLQGHVEGFVKFLGEQAHVSCVGARVCCAWSTSTYPDSLSSSSCMETLPSGPVTLAKWLGKNPFASFDSRSHCTRLVTGPSLRLHGMVTTASLSHSPPMWISKGRGHHCLRRSLRIFQAHIVKYHTC